MKLTAVVNQARRAEVGLSMNYQSKFQANSPLCLINDSLVYKIEFSPKISTENV